MRAFVWAVMLSYWLAGCVDPMAGDWVAEVDNACGERDAFNVDRGLGGRGRLVAHTSAGVCLPCDFALELEALGSGDYDGRLVFDLCRCGESDEAAMACTLSGERLSCTIDWQTPARRCLSGAQAFVRSDP